MAAPFRFENSFEVFHAAFKQGLERETGEVLSDSCEELRGLTVDLYQAAELSKRLGLMIK